MIRLFSALKTFSLTAVLGVSAVFFLPACSDQSAAPDAAANNPAPPAAELTSLAGAKVLVFSKTAGWRHDSIPAGITALQKLASDNQFAVVASEDASLFSDEDLRQFNAIVFLNTTLDVLDEEQELAMERYIQAGGGFVGIHAAADTEWEGDWFWYRNLVGAVFKNHPNTPSNVQNARVVISDKNHTSTQGLPEQFELADEWYNYRDIYEFINVVAKVDESTYQGGEHGHDHPISWAHEYDGGRAFYTGLGHSIETFSNAHFLQHLLGGIRYAVGLNYQAGSAPRLDYSKARPEHNRFIKKTLVENLNEPVKFDFFPNGDALIALRPGSFSRVDYKTGKTFPAGQLEVGYHKYMEWGLVGVAIDPAFAQTNWVYAAFTVKDAQGNHQQRLARFQWRNNQIDVSSEQQLLNYPIDNNCCHTGGDLQFGNNGELFFSTGDNTNPHDQDGYAPVDFRPDMKKNDGLRAPGNTQDLRGKVLRIKPTADGGYSIPAGNLFSDAKIGRPEIYVMGARNPYSLTFDKKTNTLFYGDVGPDASNDSAEKGPRGYDEINRVTAPGNFGWPLVIGQNRPYNLYDYVAKKSGDVVDVNNLYNNSPNNTGSQQLPAAQPAFIAYPYGISEQFPELGTGGRTALVADVYHSDHYPESLNRYPAYYNNKLFISDFMRAWVKVVSFDDQGRIQKIEPFAPQINYSLPIDARFAPDGTLYVLEYGMSWFTGNPDARLARIEYVGAGNRPPLALIGVDKQQAGLPASIAASAQGSVDPDGDKLRYQWTLGCVEKSAEPHCATQVVGAKPELKLALNKAGKYSLVLMVTDSKGAQTSASQLLEIGNEPASIRLDSTQNKSFYWGDTNTFHYDLALVDQEDGVITQTDDNELLIQFAYRGAQQTSGEGHQQISMVEQGKNLLDANNCLGCHKLDEKMVGPALRDVAKKYQKDPKALAYLVHKIGNGGSGVWGEMNMPGFSGLTEADRTALATYVLSLVDNSKAKSLALSAKLELKAHQTQGVLLQADKSYVSQGNGYVLTASYTDKGANGMAPISVKQQFLLQPHRFDFYSVFNPDLASKKVSSDKYQELQTIKLPASGKWVGFALGRYDLTEIQSLKIGAFIDGELDTWQVEVRRNNAEGEVLATGNLSATQLKTYSRSSIPLTASAGESELYLQVKTGQKSAAELRLQDISFEK